MALLVGKQNGQAPENCQMISLTEKGLAILPVRYAVVPKGFHTTLPGALSGNGVTDVKLSHHQYVTRALREGYLYIYYEGHPDNIKWEAYRVNEDSTLAYLDPDALHLPGVTFIHELNRCVVIDNASKQKTVWFAFSEHPWSKDTFNAMQSDAALRKQRMQDFEPAKWINNPQHDHAMPITEANLKQVMEYSDDIHDFEALADDEDEDAISDKLSPLKQPTGKYYTAQLKANRTRYPLNMQSHATVSTVKNSGAKAGKTKQQPAIFACWDHLGIAHELNGFMLDVAGWVSQYQQEWQQEIHAAEAIASLQQAFKDKAVAEITDKDRRQSEAIHRMEKQRERNRMYYGGQRYTPEQVDARMEQVDQKFNDYFKSDRFKQWQQARAKGAENRSKSSWADKYQNKYDTGRLELFNVHYRALTQEADTLSGQRTQDLRQWLESEALLHALSEYHQHNISDGLAFESAVGNAIEGIATCDAGTLQLEQWLNEASVSDSNLLWRALASNQIDGITSLSSILSAAHAQKETALSTLVLNGLGSVQAHMKNLLDINMQSMGIVAAMNEPGSVKFATGGLEKIYNTVGARLFHPFIANNIDTVGRFLMEGVLAARANIDFKLLLKQEFMDVAEDVLDYAEDWVDDSSLRYIRQFAKPIERLEATAEAAAEALEKRRKIRVKHLMRQGRLYTDKWTALIRTTDKSNTAINAVVEARFGMVFGFVQLIGIGLMHNKQRSHPEEQRIKAELGIAYLTLGATIAETSSKYIEGVNPGSSKLVPLKIAGGSLMAVAGVWQTYLDYSDMTKYFGEGKAALGSAYLIKGIVSTIATGLSIMSVVGATSATVKAIAVRRVAGSAVTSVAKFAVGRSIMVWSLWLGIGGLVLEQIILAIMDDDLQNWLEQSPFGVVDQQGQTNETPFYNLEQQTSELEKAVAAVMS